MVALSIAGFDNSAGAGILADIRTFNYFGIYGVGVITALAIQNTQKVHEVFPIPPQKVKKQIEVIFDDFNVEGVKIGMLSNEDTVKAVHESLRDKNLKFIILDPVFKSKSGKELLTKEGIEELKRSLLKISYLITPNIPEAEVLCGMKIKSLEDVKECAKRIKNFGVKNVLIKGGHLQGEKAVDILYDGKDFYTFESEKVNKTPRGTGCVFSSAILSNLIKGESLINSVKIAKEFITERIKESVKLGKGYPVMFF